MSHKSDQNQPVPQDQQPKAGGMDRRALLRAGIASTPVLLTLVSQPVAATGTTCTVASSFVSGATFASRNPGATTRCASTDCETWRSKAINDAALQTELKKYKVIDVFGTTSSSWCNSTLYTVLTTGSAIAQSGETGVLQHLIALYLNIYTNAASNPLTGNVQANYITSTTYVVDVWQNFKANGDTYKPGTGIEWDSTKVIAWVRKLISA